MDKADTPDIADASTHVPNPKPRPLDPDAGAKDLPKTRDTPATDLSGPTGPRVEP